MAGGIFTSRPFELNIKCVIFSAIFIALYWFLPTVSQRNIFMLPLIFVVTYIALAWYDWYYDCDTRMYSGNKGFSLTSAFKPLRMGTSAPRTPVPGRDIPIDGVDWLPSSEARAGKYVVKGKEAQKYLHEKAVYIFHVFAIAPLLAYIGYMGNKADPRVFSIILYLGILAGLYHGALFLLEESPF